MRPKSSRIRIYHSGNHPDMMKLEVNKLGRLYHKIPKIFNDKYDHIDARLSIYFLKKYRVNVALKNLDFHMDVWQKNSQIFSDEIGSLALDIERSLLLSVLQDYYGLNKDKQETLSLEQTPVTKTEERLKNKLAHELVTLITGDNLFSLDALTIKADPASLITNWSYRVDFSLDGYEGKFSLLLDNAHVDRLLANLRQDANSNRSAQKPGINTHTSFMSLPVRLNGRLAALSLTVETLSRLQSGDILPIALGDNIPLYIGQQPIFNAVIAEDRGKLFFSEFTERGSEKSHD
ncbi:FliM/FliN family flagellar motor C-terminal domain-containing protein [Erwinia oleae]|uniref:FliM/FliN family flagellar motor C-terminal domain-containing protein n=1 Tax=Erwinia oleae TaxID=796334 RepID=UPI00054E87ED|nr:FliM/FliN family flagellar motor C-terminal domain-containing protein [Erwinia oleae]